MKAKQPSEVQAGNKERNPKRVSLSHETNLGCFLAGCGLLLAPARDCAFARPLGADGGVGCGIRLFLLEPCVRSRGTSVYEPPKLTDRQQQILELVQNAIERDRKSVV